MVGVKLSLRLIKQHAMKTNALEEYLHAFLTLALDGQLHVPREAPKYEKTKRSSRGFGPLGVRRCIVVFVFPDVSK
jgi:hypothetical protein